MLGAGMRIELFGYELAQPGFCPAISLRRIVVIVVEDARRSMAANDHVIQRAGTFVPRLASHGQERIQGSHTSQYACLTPYFQP
jgi:hypothetical protein